MTLIAGTPHFACLCPNGRIKPFCVALFSGTNGCCNGPCCSASAVEDGKGAVKGCCCCKANREKAQDESRPSSKLAERRCRRSLVDGIVAVPSPCVQDLTAHLFVLAAETPTVKETFEVFDSSLADRSHWPPPTDLVMILQHFLI